MSSTRKAKHSAKTAEWYTPDDIVERARKVLGCIDFDPCTNETANKRIKAAMYFNAFDDGLKRRWPSGTVLLNPPTRKTQKFWKKLMEHRDCLNLSDAIYIAYSIEQLATIQEPIPLAHFPMVIPRRRIDFLKPDGTPGGRASHANAIVYVPGYVDRTQEFFDVFGDLGEIVQHQPRKVA